MRIKLLFISMLLLLGAVHLNAQNEPSDDRPKEEDRACVSFAQVVQDCKDDGTVTITFLISNDSRCRSSGVTITDENGIGQSYPISTNGQTVSNVPITYAGATPGSELCFDVILHGSDGRECCRTTVCIEVDCCDLPGCCNLDAELISTGGCAPNAWARIIVSGGAAPYTGPSPSSQPGFPGNFILQGLSGGSQTFIFTDSEGCDVEITVEIPENDLEAELISIGGCAPNAWARIIVTGGTAPYTGPSPNIQPGFAGNFILQELSGGTHTFTFTDSEGCEVDISVDIPESDLEAEFISTGGCDPNNRWAHIVVTGGTAPYTGPSPSIQPGFPGNFVLQGLSTGVQTIVFTDSDGCEVEVTVIIPSGSCDQFDNINLNENSAPLPPITSEISATIGVSIVGWCIPDKVEVLVNGIEVLELIAGTGGCTGMPTVMGAYETFCVVPCDVVEIITTGNICPGEFNCPGATGTAFDVNISCTLKNGGGSLKAPDFSVEQIGPNRELAFNYNSMKRYTQQAVKVYPNPVIAELNIMSTDPLIEFQTARIINSAGQVIYTENMSNIDQVKIDASIFPKGAYIVEIIDSNGDKMVKKIMKLN